MVFGKIKSMLGMGKKKHTEDKELLEDSDSETSPKSSKKKNFDFEEREERNKNELDWFGDRYQSLLVQRNIAIFLLVASILCVTFTSISLAVITQSKTIEPFVIEIERKQGLVTYVNNNNQVRDYTQDELVRNYFIRKYIEARETFDTKNYEYFYHKVGRFLSEERVYKQFLMTLRSGNRDNPVKLLANNETSKVSITSITTLRPNVLQVRFVVEGRFGDGSTVRSNRIALIEYNYFNLPTEEERREINPLGFMVTSYKVSDENIQ